MSKGSTKTDQLILQASAIPYRYEQELLEFCLITTIRKGRWGFPKGFIDPGETYVEAALKEAHEEAGLRGRILTDTVGTYEYAKLGRPVHVTVALMEVTASDDHWQEIDVRQRRWAPYVEARSLLAQKRLRKLLDVAAARLG